jgi:hypothetical protein
MTRKQIKRERQNARIEAAYADGSLTPDDVKYRREIKNKIRKGVLPRWTFVKAVDPLKTHKGTGLPNWKIKKFVYDDAKGEATPVYGGIKIILMSTVDLLCKKIPQ